MFIGHSKVVFISVPINCYFIFSLRKKNVGTHEQPNHLSYIFFVVQCHKGWTNLVYIFRLLTKSLKLGYDLFRKFNTYTRKKLCKTYSFHTTRGLHDPVSLASS